MFLGVEKKAQMKVNIGLTFVGWLEIILQMNANIAASLQDVSKNIFANMSVIAALACHYWSAYN